MLIFLENYKVGIKTAMKIAGYIERPKAGDFIRPMGNDRWHAKPVGSKAVSIHYDLTIDGKHNVFDMPLASNAERKRILRRLDRVKLREMEPERLSYLIGKFKDPYVS